MPARLGFNELAGDAHLIAGPLDTPLKHVTGAEPPPDVADIDALPLEDERGAARDHEQGTEARQRRGDFFHDPVRKPVGVRIAGNALEREDGKRRPVVFALRGRLTVWRSRLRDIEAVAALDDRAKHPTVGVADHAPNLTHALRDAVLGDRHVRPNGLEKLVARHDAPWIARQRQEKLERFRSQRNLGPAAVAQGAAAHVQHDISEPKRLHASHSGRMP